MHLDKNDIQKYKQLKTHLKYAKGLNIVGYILLLLSFVCLLFMPAYTSAFLIGALIVNSHQLFSHTGKQLSRLFEKYFLLDLNDSSKAAGTHDSTNKSSH